MGKTELLKRLLYLIGLREKKTLKETIKKICKYEPTMNVIP